MNLNKQIREGWTVQDFINELEMPVEYAITGYTDFRTIYNKEELKEFLIKNQPYYKKHIPEVYNYFKKKYKL